MLDAINEKLERAKFVGDLKPIVRELAETVCAGPQSGPRISEVLELREANRRLQERLDRLEAVALEHAKLLTPEAFNEEPQASRLITPAEAATDAPSD